MPTRLATLQDIGGQHSLGHYTVTEKKNSQSYDTLLIKFKYGRIDILNFFQML